MPAALVVTHHTPTLDIASGILHQSGVHVVTATSGSEAVRSLLTVRADVMVIDGLSVNAEALTRDIRPVSASAPLVYITNAAAKWSRAPMRLYDRDSVVSRPIRESEMSVAVRLALGLPNAFTPGRLTIGELTLDVDAMRVSGADGAVPLTPTETRLMRCLVRANGEIVSVSALMRLVWGIDPDTASRDMVRAHVRNLREKLRRASGRDGLLETIPRRGYRLLSR